jgi:hypothetical protein
MPAITPEKRTRYMKIGITSSRSAAIIPT